MHPKEFQSELSTIAPAGSYVAIRVGFYAPETEMNLFPKEWVDHYTMRGHALADPLLHWCHRNSGAVRWSELDELEPHPIMRDYHAFGFDYGGIVSIPRTADLSKRTLGIFARRDRELLDSELQASQDILRALHGYQPEQPTSAQLEALQLYSQGYRQKEIAYHLDISVSAVKARLRGATDRLNAKSIREAAFLAVDMKLF